MQKAIAIAAIIGVGLGIYGYVSSKNVIEPTGAASKPASRSQPVSVAVPELAGNAVLGEKLFTAKCSACHGENGVGVENAGPPLIHKIYEPSHHGDAAFMLAARNGVRSHHWPFGDMPPVEGVTDGDVKMIVEYIRAIQRANGID